MAVLRHKKPCPQCPFRRESARGYLGSDTPEAFIATTMAGEPMPCHLTVDYADPCWRDALDSDTVSLCAGALIFLRNTCRLPHDCSLAEARNAVDANHKTVFSRQEQFLEHHEVRERAHADDDDE